MAVRQAILALILLPLLVGSAITQSSSSSSKSKRSVHVPVEEEQQASIVARAETALSNGDFATAEPLLKQAVTANPKDFRAWFDLGFLYSATGRKAESLEAYRKSVAVDPTVFESNLNLGLLLAQNRDPEAEKYLRAATQLKPGAKVNENLANAWLSLGHVIESRDSAGALAAYAEASRLQPADPEPRLSAGSVLERQGQLEPALKEYQAAAEVDPRSSEAQLGLANIYMKLRRLPEAEQCLRRYLSSDPQNAHAQLQLGRVLFAENRLDEAIAAMEAGLKLAPPDPDVQREVASLYRAAGQYEKAEAAYRAYLQLEPGNAAARAALGSVLLRLQQAPEAQKELLAAVKLDPRSGETYGELALAASTNKEYVLAIRALDERAKYLPEAPGTLFLRAGAYDNLRDYKQAAEYYRQFLAAANGRFPDQEWQARHRLVAIAPDKR